MVEKDDQPGIRTLRLLAERPVVRVLRELIGGPLQPSELEQRLPDVAHSALMRGLGELMLAHAVSRKRIASVPPRAYYELTVAGHALLPLIEASACWERRWAPLTHPDAPGAFALRLLADDGHRALLSALAHDPLRPIDIDRRLDLGRSATRRRLGHLLAQGLLTRTRADGNVRYELTSAAHQLEPIVTLAAGWERTFARPAHPFPAPRSLHAPSRTPALDFDG